MSTSAVSDRLWPNQAVQLSIAGRQYENPARPTTAWIRPEADSQVQARVTVISYLNCAIEDTRCFALPKPSLRSQFPAT
jgi:hypothetical protein